MEDIHCAARHHVAITAHLPNTDPRKFTFATPKEVARAYLRITDPVTGGVPSSKRIIQDCNKWVESLKTVREAGGVLVEGFGRNGHRKEKVGAKRGGARTKKELKEIWIHPDAQGLSTVAWKTSVAKVEGPNQTPSTITASANTDTTAESSSSSPPLNAVAPAKSHQSPPQFVSILQSDDEVTDDENEDQFVFDDINVEDDNNYEALDEECVAALMGLTSS